MTRHTTLPNHSSDLESTQESALESNQKSITGLLHNYQRPVVVGVGVTGLSVARYLKRSFCSTAITFMDTRLQPSGLAELQVLWPGVRCVLGELSESILLQADVVIVSPGVSLDEPALQAVQTAGIPVLGDVELFVQATQVPVLAVTGTNGKSTVVSLLAHALQRAGLKVGLGGNIGAPVLDMLSKPAPDYYVLELSSFQLQTTPSLAAEVAVCLNLSPDHLDRHHTMAEYLAAKQLVYRHCRHAVVNSDEPELWQGLGLPASTVGFSMHAEGVAALPINCSLLAGNEVAAATSILKVSDNQYARMAVDALSPAIVDFPQNALAVMAVMRCLNIAWQNYNMALTDFIGLPHRCQLVPCPGSSLRWYNDSKATNVGSAIAALQSVSRQAGGRVLWIAGGQAKGVDLSSLQPVIAECVAGLVLMGEDAELIRAQAPANYPCQMVDNMQQAVSAAALMALDCQVDTVLLAPACASLDQYENYAARGREFVKWIQVLGKHN